MSAAQPGHNQERPQAPKFRVRRQVMPWRSKTAAVTGAAWDRLPTDNSPSGDDPISTFFGCLMLLVQLPLLLPVLLLTPFWLIEFLLQLLVLPIAWPLRAAGVWPITLLVRRGGTTLYRESVSGRAAATLRTQQLEYDAAAGRFF